MLRMILCSCVFLQASAFAPRVLHKASPARPTSCLRNANLSDSIGDIALQMSDTQRRALQRLATLPKCKCLQRTSPPNTHRAPPAPHVIVNTYINAFLYVSVHICMYICIYAYSRTAQ